MATRKPKETPKTLKIVRIDINISDDTSDKMQATFDLSATINTKGNPIMEVFKNTTVKLNKNTLDIGRIIGESLTQFITESAIAASCASVEL
jgi:hypothetical protein